MDRLPRIRPLDYSRSDIDGNGPSAGFRESEVKLMDDVLSGADEFAWMDVGGGSRRRSALYERIYDVVRRIPRGKVSTYGRVAEVAGLDGHARLVGYALHALPDGSDVPWHRVINHAGRISARKRSSWGAEQRRRLENEGLEFDERGRIDLARNSWKGERSA